jgi:hypothetical protein
LSNPDLPVEVINGIKQLEKMRGSPLVLIHSLEPLSRENVDELDKALQGIDSTENLDVILHSFGGDIDAAYKMVNILRSKTKKLTIMIPSLAKSAATLITLGADEILMPLSAELGPLDSIIPHPKDPQKHISALDAFKTFEFIRNYLFESMDVAVRLFLQRGLPISDAVKNALELVSALCHPLYTQIDPLFMGESERTLLIAEEYGKRLLERRTAPLNKDELINQIVRNYPSHSFVIDLNEAQRLGLNARCFPDDQLEIAAKIIENIKSESPIIYVSNMIANEKRNVVVMQENKESHLEVSST